MDKVRGGWATMPEEEKQSNEIHYTYNQWWHKVTTVSKLNSWEFKAYL